MMDLFFVMYRGSILTGSAFKRHAKRVEPTKRYSTLSADLSDKTRLMFFDLKTFEL